MDIIAHDNTQILIEWMRKFEKDHAHAIRMSGYEDDFSDFINDLEKHKDYCADIDGAYAEVG